MTDSRIQATHLDRLQAIGESMHGISDLNDMCASLVNWVSDLCALPDCVAYVRLGNLLTQMAATGVKFDQEAQEIVNRIGLPLGSGIVGMAALNAEAVYVPDVTANQHYIFDEFHGQSEFAVPIVHRGEVVGVLDSEHPQTDGISAENRQIMQSLAVLAAPHLTALLRRQEGGAPDYTDVIADLTHLPAISQGNLQAACATITERAARTLRVDRANVWLFKEDDSGLLECIDNYDLASNEHTHGPTIQCDAFPTYFNALKDERVIIATDSRKDERTREFRGHYLAEHDIRSSLDAPIRLDGEVVGVLCLEVSGNIRKWNNEEAGFVGTLSDFATIALVTRQRSLAQSALIQAQKMESLGRLAGGISHDFNNLLTVISGAVETLQLNEDRSPSDNKLLNLIGEAGERARKLTRNLMAFGGNQHLQLEAVSAADLINKVHDLTEGIIREDIRLDFRGLSDDLWLQCDKTQLEQVLLNLMINAVDAMPEGGSLTVSVASHGDDEVRISVSDTGNGMSDAVRQSIFEPFFTTKGEFGTGLGLSISLGIVQQHGGTLTCESELGAGTSFDIVLSRVAAPATAEVSRIGQPERSRNGDGPNVLLVEDEIGVRNVVTEMIKALGYEATVAENATHALELLDTASVDLLLTDVIMPDMRGPELYRSALQAHPELSALFVSGYTEEVISEIPSGGNKVGYLAKPFTMTQLADAIEAIIAWQRVE